MALSRRAVRGAGTGRRLSRRARAVRIAGTRDRGRADRLLQPDALRAVADRDAGYFRARFLSVRDRSFHPRLQANAAALCLRAGGIGRGAGERLQMERAVRARDLHRDRRSDPPDAGLAHALCRCQCAGLVPAGPVAGFPSS
ncbi:hypothetical protein chiPu_0033894, partial [Chiloscyllium punctatum]|nr:hypothetical protein [Chiloscyllium punctatum]